MARVIDMKIPAEYFEKDRNNRLEARIARFDLRKDDVVRFHEWDMEKRKYTGWYYDRKVKDVHKIHKATKFWTKRDLEKFGLYVFELGRSDKKFKARKNIKPVNKL